MVSKISNPNISGNFKLLTIPSLHVQGYELSEELTRERIDSLVEWSCNIDNPIVQFFDGEK